MRTAKRLAPLATVVALIFALGWLGITANRSAGRRAVVVGAGAGLMLMTWARANALRQASESRQQLLSTTTHELKTPVTAIRGAALTLGTRWRQMPPEKVDEFLGIIHRRTDGLTTLIDRILIGTRLEAGREMAFRPKPVQVAPVVRAIAAELDEASPHHDVVAVADESVSVQADPDCLDHVLGLLVENAIKYSPEGGEVRIEVVEEADSVRFAISDHGVGIAPKERKKIFQPYYRGGAKDVTRAPGVGLGLSIARHLVAGHGGRIWVESQPEAGSTFLFTMPKVAAAEEKAPGPVGVLLQREDGSVLLSGAGAALPATGRADRDAWLPVTQAARAAGVHPNTVRGWVRRGAVEAAPSNTGRGYVVRLGALLDRMTAADGSLRTPRSH